MTVNHTLLVKQVDQRTLQSNHQAKQSYSNYADPLIHDNRSYSKLENYLEMVHILLVNNPIFVNI